MSYLLRVTINVIKRRIAEGEKLEAILLDYPRLSSEEINIIKQEVNQ
ncbi:antitoxin [Paludicola sp. MB14-C6]|nr:antitoxin [Paludicola sp. MB14-C6]WMJ23449.1 antitoxin [Paludicola sp. MB14-C6]